MYKIILLQPKGGADVRSITLNLLSRELKKAKHTNYVIFSEETNGERNREKRSNVRLNVGKN